MKVKKVVSKESGLMEIDANFLWEQIEKFAAYGFNLSHAVSYSLISYMAAYLKAHYAGEFYAASMTILDDEKVKQIAKEATNDGFIVKPPDINHSTDSFEIVYDPKRAASVLYSPLTAVKNVSAKVCQHILEKRSALAVGFTDYSHFANEVEARKCNKRAKDNLDQVGAFAEIEPGQQDSLHPDRLRKQKELMGALAVADVKPDRAIDISPFVKSKLQDLYDDMASNGRDPVMPSHGKKPKFMVITDKPTFFEAQEGQSFKGKSSKYIKEALAEAGLKPSDGYYTHLIKVEPENTDTKQPSREEIDYYGNYLKQEIELLQPQLVILAGTKSIRYLFPDSKGSAEDLARSVEFEAEQDCSYMMCINPQMVYVKPHTQELLNKVFEDVANLLD